MTGRIVQLVLKDLEQNFKALLLFSVSALAFPPAFYLVMGSSGSSGFVGVAASYIVLAAPMLLAFWLVGQEKVKGTFRVLRMLPIRGRHIIVVKTLTTTGITLVLLNIVLLVEPKVLEAFGNPSLTISAILILGLNVATVFMISVCTAIYTVLENKVATQASYWLVMGLVLAILLADKYSNKTGVDLRALLERATSEWYLHYWAIPVVALSVLFITWAGRTFERRDWADLEES